MRSSLRAFDLEKFQSLPFALPGKGGGPSGPSGSEGIEVTRLFFLDDGPDRLHEYTLGGGVTDLAGVPTPSRGLGRTSNGSFWYADDGNPAIIREFDKDTGSILSSFSSNEDVDGLTVAFDDRIWVCHSGGTEIRAYLSDGTLDETILVTGRSYFGIAVNDDASRIWLVEISGDTIYEIDPATGSDVNSFSAPGTSPNGMHFFNNSLWNIDAGTDRIYELSPDTGGTIRSWAPAGASIGRGVVAAGDPA